MTASLQIMSNAEYLAARLRARRQALGLSQHAVAKLVGTSQSHISELENGEALGIQLNTAERWCEALGFRLWCEVQEWGREL